jgi:ribbon-helix-helix CopG family protein
MSTTMHRLQISIPQWEKQFLDERAKRDGVSVAEVIRQLIEREAEVSREGADSILKFSGFIKDPVPLINGIPVSENVDLYLADNFTRKHSGARERPHQTYRHQRKKKS